MSTIDFKQYLTKDPLDDYENPEKYKEFIPKLEKYRQALKDGILPEYSVELPEDPEILAKKQFNAVKYLYENKLLSAKEFEITDSSIPQLIKKLSDGELTAVEVFKAYAKRTTIAHQFLNCALELFPEDGLKRAEYLDDYFKKNGKLIGPLHGIPISLKEQMDFKGRIRHACYVSQIDHVCKEHGTNAKILEDLGAVFYIRTTQPQTLMHLCSDNNFIGISRNPFNMGLTPGGSSSGEGALTGFGGSPVGVGTDIGGSIRAPAAYSGSHGLRPTSKRIGLLGSLSSGYGQESVMAVAGPLARTIDDIEYWMKSYINEGKPWEVDQNALRLPWKDVAKPKPQEITIGVMYDDGIVKVTPPIERALKETVTKLEKAGVKVVEFKPIRTQEALDTVQNMYTCDGNYAQRKLLSDSGEPLCDLTKWAMNAGEGSKGLSIHENRLLNMSRDSLRQEYTRFMIDNKIDFILSPTYNNVAPKPRRVFNWSYTSLFNLLDFPTLVFQTGVFQDPKIDTWDIKDYKFRSIVEELEMTQYDPNEFVGAPVGLQLSGRRYFDEEVVAAGKTIVEILGVDLHKLYK